MGQAKRIVGPQKRKGKMKKKDKMKENKKGEK
jgi:hypothetical protein